MSHTLLLLGVPVLVGLLISGRRSAIVVAAAWVAVATGLSIWAATDDFDDPGWIIALFVFITSWAAFGAVIGFGIRRGVQLFAPRPLAPGP